MRASLLLTLLISLPGPVAIAQTELGPPNEAAAPVERQEIDEDENQGFTSEQGEVKIIEQNDGKVIEEYSLNGRVYMIKVTQKGFPPYYLIDRDGDGTMEEQVSEVPINLKPPSWVLKRW